MQTRLFESAGASQDPSFITHDIPLNAQNLADSPFMPQVCGISHVLFGRGATSISQWTLQISPVMHYPGQVSQPY